MPQKLNLECIIVHHKSAKEVGFIPATSLLNEIERILEWKADIVDVHKDSRLETRKNFEHVPIYVAVHFGYVGGVNEKDVTRLEGFKSIHCNILKSTLKYLVKRPIDRFNKLVKST